MLSFVPRVKARYKLVMGEPSYAKNDNHDIHTIPKTKIEDAIKWYEEGVHFNSKEAINALSYDWPTRYRKFSGDLFRCIVVEGAVERLFKPGGYLHRGEHGSNSPESIGEAWSKSFEYPLIMCDYAEEPGRGSFVQLLFKYKPKSSEVVLNLDTLFEDTKKYRPDVRTFDNDLSEVILKPKKMTKDMLYAIRYWKDTVDENKKITKVMKEIGVNPYFWYKWTGAKFVKSGKRKPN